MTDVDSGPSPGSDVVTLAVTGDGHHGTGPIRFDVAEDQLARVVIIPE